jgi:RNA polymerase sigma-70 factor (ECF subfamily)
VEPTDHLRPERYRSYLLVLARMSLRDWGPAAKKVEASDVVQDALLRAHKALPQFQGTTSAELQAWLRKILETQLLDALRYWHRGKRDAELERSIQESVNDSIKRIERLAADQTSPSQRVGRHERAIRLTDAMTALSEDQRTVVELHHLSGYSVSETAERMGRTKPAVAGLLRRGLAQLREGLKDLE